MNHLITILLFFIFILLIFFAMDRFYKNNIYNQIKKYLLKFNNFEKEILKTILKNKEQKIPLEQNSEITKKFIDLQILFKLKNDENNPLNAIYSLNSKIFDFIHKDNELKKIYLKK
ncbi:super-infection exclusion protein B [Candidatus Phytoplasma pini]|uniref:Uncharacterized protein n=1 Tax=Candidatus Phytoplasma pini TaxID=267362 RepID=A0A559KJ93_9MOLU|nr:super-infection exclusion protein B [Candidatus Phytoplasma pini]TVY12203.1 hypothetical protein MDPP_00271 [Candidatus Phytoplasma pini]